MSVSLQQLREAREGEQLATAALLDLIQQALVEGELQIGEIYAAAGRRPPTRRTPTPVVGESWSDADRVTGGRPSGA